MAEDDQLISMLERCSREEYVYFDSKVNRKREKEILLYKEKVASDSWNLDSTKLRKPQKVKTGNFGYLREIGNMVDELSPNVKSLFVKSN